MLVPNMNDYLGIFAVKFAGVIITLILNIFLARHLGAEQFGVYSQALSIVMIGSTFVLVGGVNRNLKSLSETMKTDAKQGVGVFFDSVCLSLLMTSISAAVFLWVVSLNLSNILVVGLVSLTATTNIFIAFYRVRVSLLKSELWLNIIRPLISLVSIIAFSIFLPNRDAEAMLFAYLLALLLSIILIYKTISSHFGRKFVFSASGAWRELFAGHRTDFWLNGATQAAMMNAPVLMFLFVDQPEKSAFAAVAARLSMIFIIPRNVFGAIIEPTIAADYKNGNVPKIKRQFFSLLACNFLLMTSLLFVYFSFAAEIVSLTVGSEYLAGLPMINTFVLAFYFSSIFGPVGSYLNLTGGARFLSTISLLSVVFIFLNMEFHVIPLEEHMVYLLIASSQFFVLFMVWLKRMYSISAQ